MNIQCNITFMIMLTNPVDSFFTFWTMEHFNHILRMAHLRKQQKGNLLNGILYMTTH